MLNHCAIGEECGSAVGIKKLSVPCCGGGEGRGGVKRLLENTICSALLSGADEDVRAGNTAGI